MSIQASAPLAPQSIDQHFDPKGKLPSTFTVELQNGLRKTLPFQDERDFEVMPGTQPAKAAIASQKDAFE